MSNEHADITNPVLKGKLEALRIKEDAGLREEVCNEIANTARFLAVATPRTDAAPDEPRYDFPVITTTGHGYRFYPAFTDLEELRKWNDLPGVETLPMTFDDYAVMMERDEEIHGIVIDPCGANFSMERDLVDYLKVQKAFVGKAAIEQMFHQQEGGGGVRVEDPEPYPEELAAALRAYLDTDPHIRRAWLRLMINEGETSYLVIVDAAQGDAQDGFSGISSAALPHVGERYLDLLALDDPFARRAVEGVKPFYTK